MGGEGAAWIGQAPFSKLPHVFANLGDGTYFHSGHLAIRAALAANVNITYKILYNDAVAMTGGQPVDGQISVDLIAQQMAAEGVKRIAVVSEDLSRYENRSRLPAMVTVNDRKDMEAVQRELREIAGVTVLIYDQTCAAEKRRRRKKGEYPKATQRVFINEAVCEGCGDCGVQSNCTSILPVETEFGRKRAIDQSSCNQDYSCLKGFCPSFVTIEGGAPKKSRAAKQVLPAQLETLPDAVPAQLKETPYNILITGIGGTGVITIGALLGMAAHLEGKGTSALDMTGMSQKNGAVTSHVRIARAPEDIRAQRIATGEADLILGCDMLTAGALDAISKTRPGRTVAVINTHQQPPGQFAQNPDWQFPADQIRALIDESVGGRSHFIDATKLATALLGDSIATNLFMLGFAFQKGLIPLQEDSVLKAIELNGVAVDSNKQAFSWGRRAAVSPQQVESIALPAKPIVVQMPQNLETLIRRRSAFLTDYQNVAYAKRYEDLVAKVRDAEAGVGAGDSLTKAVAKYLFKLMAYKDEYEVARLYTDGDFEKRLKDSFEGDYKVTYNLAPPLLAKRDAHGHLVKARYGSWMKTAFKVLAKFKGLRGTALDPFGYTAERKMERSLVRDYESLIADLAANISQKNYQAAIKLASLPEQIRGYGHVKDRNVAAVALERERLLREFNGGSGIGMAA
jgi:indolepyruvate ferredoxin oxidoreductase